MYSVTEELSYIYHPNGKLFAKLWRPALTSYDELSPILLFHDSLGCVDLWRDFPKALSQVTGRTVIAYDRLGFGKSDPASAQLAVDFVFSEALIGFKAVTEHFNLTKVVCFGHSVGGGMAVACAASQPEICEAVVTESAQAFVEEKTLAGIRAAKESFQNVEMFNRLSKYHGQKAAWVLNAWTETWLATNFKNFSLTQVLPNVNCPLLAIHGDNDEYGSVLHPQIISENCPSNSSIKILTNCGHVPHREYSSEVIHAVASFLEDGIACKP